MTSTTGPAEVAGTAPGEPRPAAVRATAAVLRTADGPFQLEEVELDPPGHGEVVVRIAGVGSATPT